MSNSVLAQIAALKSMPVTALKARWHELFDTAAPPYNRRFLESRLAYRIQELAYGGLKPETLERLAALAEQVDRKGTKRARSAQDRPIAGTRLVREWQGIEHCVTVRDAGYEYEGRPLQIPLRYCAPDHRYPLERVDLLWAQESADAAMNKPVVRKLRCAVYTRKSIEEGLEMKFNSLDAQREACEAYIASQKAEGWLLVPDRYDDGGYSGGNLERPALKRLMADIEARRIDIVVVYKIDRLTRALVDFAKLIEVLDRNAVTFVSVTQSFNTTTSMGRLMLNVLLSFAQFEREVTGERIRDKFAASRKKGIWMGGWAPLGYDIRDRKLIINEAEAAHVRLIFERFARIRSVTKLIPILAAEGIKAKSGKPVEKGYLYRIISNPVYVGEAVHKGTSYPGEHRAIIDRALWKRVQDILKESPRQRAANSRARTPALLKGLIFGPSGTAMTPSHTRRNGKLYRYYVAMDVLKRGAAPGPTSRVAAGDVERAIIDQLRAILRAPEIIVRTWRTARRKIDNITEAEVRGALEQLDPLWNELFPAEQARIVQLLVERVDIQEDGIEIRFRIDGLASLAEDFKNDQEAA